MRALFNVNSIADIFAAEDLRIEECDGSWLGTKRALEACREERRPYVLCTTAQSSAPTTRPSGYCTQSEIATARCATNRDSVTTIKSILVPVSRLEEEQYKAELSTYIARKTGAEIVFLQAKDYGSRAKQNIDRMVTRIKRVSESTGTPIAYRVVMARRDSDHVMREAAERAYELRADVILLTASREYGLDDIVFGPAELSAIRKSPVPCILVNPRGDLFSLCD